MLGGQASGSVAGGIVVVVAQGQDLRSVRGNRDGVLEVTAQAAIYRDRRPTVVEHAHGG